MLSAIAAIVAKAGVDVRVVGGNDLAKPTDMAALAGAPMRSMRGIRVHARTCLWCGLSGGIVCVFQRVSRETTNLHPLLCSAHVQRSGGHGTHPNDTSSGLRPLKLSHQELHTKTCQTGIVTSNACARTSPRMCKNISLRVREHPHSFVQKQGRCKGT